MHAAALTANAVPKGGPYTVGPISGGQQYGVLDIFDNGGPSVACRFLGTRVGEGRKVTQIFSSSAGSNKENSIVNISTLNRLRAPNDSIVSGFVISGTTESLVLVRGVGPTLASFGVADALLSPVLSVFKGDQLIATNNGWAGTAPTTADEATRAFDQAGAFRFIDASSNDTAVLLKLAPGTYTAQVKSGDGGSGAALLEVYDLP